MGFPIRKCVACGEEFELRPEKPGFANRCWTCSVADEDEKKTSAGDYKSSDSGLNEARRKTMRQMLYRKEQ